MNNGFFTNKIRIARFWINASKKLKCWIWHGQKRGAAGPGRLERYGGFRIGNKTLLAHRISWQIINGGIPKGLLILHKCDKPLCINPKHLFIGTQEDNVRDMFRKKRNNSSFGEKVGTSKLTAKQVTRLRKEYGHRGKGGKNQIQLAKKYGISQGMVGFIVRREAWKKIK